MKKLLVTGLLPIILSALVSAQTPKLDGEAQSTNERGQAEPGKPAPSSAVGKSARTDGVYVAMTSLILEKMGGLSRPRRGPKRLCGC